MTSPQVTTHTVAIIQARMGSSRLPGKVLEDLGGIPVLAWVVRAAKAVIGVDKVIVATGDTPENDAIAKWCEGAEVSCFRGSESDVLGRYHACAVAEGASHIVRLTADCPLLDPTLVDVLLAMQQQTGADYVSNTFPPVWADGLDAEIFTMDALEKAHRGAKNPSMREHVTQYLYSNLGQFDCRGMECPIPQMHHERWTLDEPEDLVFLRQCVPHLPQDRPPYYTEVLRLLQQHPEWRELNQSHQRNAGMLPKAPTLPQQEVFTQSVEWLERAEKVIPLGSQTFSKSQVQWPKGYAPLFLTHGRGAKVWDEDGNRYIDMVNGLLPVVLGYADPDVDAAIRLQLQKGISFSLATRLEAELAERMVAMIPCAEQVRFCKNGTDATSAAIRLARAFTGRDHVLVCGYHGWQDWYIGSTTRHRGIPDAVRGLTHSVPYNDLAALESMLDQHRDQVAVMIMEPMNMVDPAPGYLAAVKGLLHKHGALLAFDEVITGFRFAKGGAQEFFGVTPDLAAFGKAMGNGMPISAIAGRRDVMQEMNNVFFSGTFGGEALSIAAAIALIDKMQREPVIEHLWHKGEQLTQACNELVKKHQLTEHFHFKGKAPWMIWQITPHETARVEAIKTLYITQMARYGVLSLGSHNISYALDDVETAHIIAAYDATFETIASELATGDLERRLPCPALEPVFKVR